MVRTKGEPACIQQYGLDDGQITALLYYEKLPITRERNASCPWLLVHQGRQSILEHAVDMQDWQNQALVRRSGNMSDAIMVFARHPQTASASRKAAP